MEHLASRRKLWYTLSLIVILPGVISLILFGLKRGIEFTGGTLWELEFSQPVESESIINVLNAHGLDGSRVQMADNSTGDANRVAVIRIKELQQGSAEKDAVAAAITKDVGSFTELQLSTVGSSVSRDITRRSIFAVLFASVASWRILPMPSETPRTRSSTASVRWSP